MKRLVFMMGALGLFLSVPAWTQWTPAKRLSWNPGESTGPALAVDSNHNIHVVWEDDTPGYYSGIYYRRSLDGGVTWEASRRLSWTSGNCSRPAIAVDPNSYVHVVWDGQTPGNMEIYYRKSTDKGTTWSPARRLTWTSGASVSPAIAADLNSQITAVWSEYPQDYGEIFYRRSLNGGIGWGSINRLTWTEDDSNDPLVAADATGKIHIVWREGYYSGLGICYMNSEDGIGFSSPKSLSGGSCDATAPAMAVSGSEICVIWQVGTYDQSGFYYRISLDRGESWSAVMELPTQSLDDYYNPAVGFAGTSILAVWHDYTPGYPDIYFMRSKGVGGFWNPPVRLTWNIGESRSPAIAVDPGAAVHVVWQDNTPGNNEIYYKKRN